MNVSLNGSLFMQSNNFSRERGVSLNRDETFSDKISTSLGKVKADQFTRNSIPITTKTNAGLKDEDFEYSASKWDPTDMSQDEYDEFLDYLQEKDIISEEDKKYVGYGGISVAEGEIGSIWCCYTPYENPVDDFSDGNLLAYMRCQSSYVYEGNAFGATREKHRENLYKTITGVLEEMLIKRGDTNK